jgi:hypothetical protein
VWFDGNQPDNLWTCAITVDSDSDNVTAYQWQSDTSAPSALLNEFAANANGDGPTSLTQADSLSSCQSPVPVGGGCQFSWSGSNGSGEGVYYQAGQGTEELWWTDPAQNAVIWIWDRSGGSDLGLAELQLETWFLTNVQGM